MATRNAWNTPDLTADGQLLIGQTGGRPLAANLTACGFNITNGAGSISLDTISTGQDYVRISTATAASSATIDFTSLSSTYFLYIVVIANLAPVTDGAILYMRTSSNNGISYDSTAGNYSWNECGADNTDAIRAGDSTSDTGIKILGR